MQQAVGEISAAAGYQDAFAFAAGGDLIVRGLVQLCAALINELMCEHKRPEAIDNLLSVFLTQFRVHR